MDSKKLYDFFYKNECKGKPCCICKFYNSEESCFQQFLKLMESMKQKLLWIPRIKEGSRKCDPVPFEDEVPYYVWTLFEFQDENKKPELPIIPKHHVNAFLEDQIHDWNVRNKEFHYYSRVSQGGVWLLLEYKEK